MSRLRSTSCAWLVLALLALVSSAAAAQDSFLGVYLTWKGQPFDGYHASEYAIIYSDGFKIAGNPFNIGWRQGSTHGLLEFGFKGDVSVDTVGTYDPAEGCTLIGVGGTSVSLTPGDTAAVTIPLQYRYCPAGLIPTTATGAGGLVEFDAADAALSFTDSVSADGYSTVRSGSEAGQFPHGSPITIKLTPLFGSSVQALGRSGAPGQTIVVDTAMNSAVVVRASFYFAPTFSIALGGGNPASNDTIAKGTTKAPMLEFSMNSASPQTLNTVTVSGKGTGDEHVDVSKVSLYLDANANGKVDAGEQLLATTGYTSNDGTATLTVVPGFTFTGATNLLVTYDFSLTIAEKLGGGAMLAMLPLFLVPAMRRRKRYLLLGLALTLVSVGALSSCGGSDSTTGPPPAGGSSTYQAEVTNVNVSGTDHPTTLSGHTVTVLK